MRPFLITPILLAAALLWSGEARLGAVQTGQQEHEHEAGQQQEQAEPSGMEASGEMMARHRKMMDEMKAMDARLDALVADMNAAEGEAKVEAIAALAAELVAQRKAMHARMMMMQEQMMGQMMRHMMQGGH